jgi:NAD(P)-dependent dehydrogenase (short-subunit alcohol dehydrogenase family)
MMGDVNRVHELLRLDGRVVLITGGAGHLGQALATALGELGATVALSDRDPIATEAAAAAIGRTAVAFPAELTDDVAVGALPAAVQERLGSLDVLINNAAFVGSARRSGWAVPLADQSIDVWREALEVNLTAAFVLTQAAAPLLAASGHGSIVNIASIYGLVGPDHGLYADTDMGNPAAYAAAKGGLLQLTRWSATTLAPTVRVNAVTPGGILRDQPDAFVSRYVARTPLQRMATEDDMIGAVAYLASDLSAYVTGQNLVVDGGWTAW